jgi:hypothetical protein
VHDAITDEQIAAYGQWYRAVVEPFYSHLTAQATKLPVHSEVPPGVADGKSDPFPRNDPRNHALRSRLWGVMAGVTPEQEEDIRLEALYQREKAMLGNKRHKAWFTRPYYAGNVLWCDRGLVAPTVALTDLVRQGLHDDAITLFEGNGWSGKL